jgi:hypothetical protein
VQNMQRLDYTGLIATGVPIGANGKTKLDFADGARTFALQVTTPSGAITSWSVNVEGSLDGVNWTVIGTHSANIGSTVWFVDKPVSSIRVNVTALVLGTAPSIGVSVLAAP